MKKSNKIIIIFDRIMGIFFFVASILLILMLLFVLIEVVARYFFNQSQMWVIESCEYSLLYITFLGTAWLLRKNGHIKVDLVITRLSPKARVIVDTITAFIGIGISIVITWYGVLVTYDMFQKGITAITALEPPVGILTAVVPVGGFLLLLQFIRSVFNSLEILKGEAKLEEKGDVSEATIY